MRGLFDTHRVDLDALYDVDMNKLGFDVCFLRELPGMSLHLNDKTQ